MPSRRKTPAVCRDCHAPVTFTRAQGRTGRPVTIPLDPRPDDAGQVAAYKTTSGGLLGRFLGRDEKPYGYERRYKQHACPPAEPAPPPAVQETLFEEIPCAST